MKNASSTQEKYAYQVTKQANKVVVVGVSFLVHSFRLLERNCISYYHNIHLIIQQREVPSSLGVP